jgi:hypothetical protein
MERRGRMGSSNDSIERSFEESKSYQSMRDKIRDAKSSDHRMKVDIER